MAFPSRNFGFTLVRPAVAKLSRLPGAPDKISCAAILVLVPGQARILEKAVAAMTLGEMVSLAIASWHMLVQCLTTPSGLMVIAGLVLAGTILAGVVICTRTTSMLAGSSLPAGPMGRRMAYLAALVRRQFDPDAAGRIRPRAPAALAAAA